MSLTARELTAGLKERASTRTDVGNYTPVILVERDALLTRLVAAWPNVSIPKDPNPDEVVPEGTPEDSYLRWLWSRVPDVLFKSWLRLAGLPDAPHTRRACWIAIEHRMVLPDGTLAPALQGLIQGIVSRAAARLGAGGNGQQRRHENEAQDRG